MTEVAWSEGGFVEMALSLRFGCGGAGKRRAGEWAAPAASGASQKRSGANQREAVTALPGSGQRSAEELSSRFAPQIGAGQRKVLRTTVSTAPSSGTIGQKVIGRGWRGAIAWHTRVRHLAYRGRLAFALLHQPARQHGRTVLLHPLIHQGHNLLAEIGDVPQTGQFVALQTVTRSRQQELPRRCGAGNVHGYLVMGRLYAPYRNAAVIIVKRQVRG